MREKNLPKHKMHFAPDKGANIFFSPQGRMHTLALRGANVLLLLQTGKRTFAPAKAQTSFWLPNMQMQFCFSKDANTFEPSKVVNTLCEPSLKWKRKEYTITWSYIGEHGIICWDEIK